MAIGHTRNEHGDRQDLETHLRAVADMAARFAQPLGASEAAWWLGLWHDVGNRDLHDLITCIRRQRRMGIETPPWPRPSTP